MGISIYVMPTEDGLPPRAVLAPFDPETAPTEGEGAVVGAMAVWSSDLGMWCQAGVPLPPEVGEVITEHARNLGVPGF